MLDLNSSLADILDATPRRRVEFDLSRVDIGKLTLLELLDASEVSSIDVNEFRLELVNPDKQAHLFYALAWVILRRVDKSLTYEDVCEFDLLVTGEIDEKEAQATKQRADKVVAVAALAKVSPREAEQMTVAEIEAVTDLTKRRNRATRRRR